jgi:hypothetical protein
MQRLFDFFNLVSLSDKFELSRTLRNFVRQSNRRRLPKNLIATVSSPCSGLSASANVSTREHALFANLFVRLANRPSFILGTSPLRTPAQGVVQDEMPNLTAESRAYLVGRSKVNS